MKWLARSEILLQAVLRAKLLICKPVADKTEGTFESQRGLFIAATFRLILRIGGAASARDTRRLR
jgi:hypothetical protein